MSIRLRHVAFVAVALFVAGCGPKADIPPPAPQIPAGPPPVAGVIAGPLGASLSEADRRVAADAQYDALEKGEKKSWKAKTGTTFGFVEPGAEAAGCRSYSHTVFVNGRSKTETGQGCRGADGSWKLAS